MFRNRVRLIGLAIMTGLIFSIMMAPSVLAREFPHKNKNFDTSDMNDRAANPGSTGGGFATVRTAQDGDALVFDKVVGQHLLPDTEYDIHVVISPSDQTPGFIFANVAGFVIVPVTTDSEGSFNMQDIDTGFSDTGTWRIDALVTLDGHVAGSSNAIPELELAAVANDIDVVLACQPAFTVTLS